MTILSDDPEAVTVEEFEQLDEAAPETLTFELLAGVLMMSPAPDGEHAEILADLADHLRASTTMRLVIEPGLAVGSYRKGRVRPDGVLAPVGYFRTQPSWADPSGVVMVVEVTSGRRDSDANVDRIEKRDAYAETEIPLYLLVDRMRDEAVIHSDPKDGRYGITQTVRLGQPLHIPSPLDISLDTAAE